MEQQIRNKEDAVKFFKARAKKANEQANSVFYQSNVQSEQNKNAWLQEQALIQAILTSPKKETIFSKLRFLFAQWNHKRKMKQAYKRIEKACKQAVSSRD